MSALWATANPILRGMANIPECTVLLRVRGIQEEEEDMVSNPRVGVIQVFAAGQVVQSR